MTITLHNVEKHFTSIYTNGITISLSSISTGHYLCEGTDQNEDPKTSCQDEHTSDSQKACSKHLTAMCGLFLIHIIYHDALNLQFFPFDCWFKLKLVTDE